MREGGGGKRARQRGEAEVWSVGRHPGLELRAAPHGRRYSRPVGPARSGRSYAKPQSHGWRNSQPVGLVRSGRSYAKPQPHGWRDSQPVGPTTAAKSQPHGQPVGPTTATKSQPHGWLPRASPWARPLPPSHSPTGGFPEPAHGPDHCRQVAAQRVASLRQPMDPTTAAKSQPHGWLPSASPWARPPPPSRSPTGGFLQPARGPDHCCQVTGPRVASFSQPVGPTTAAKSQDNGWHPSASMGARPLPPSRSLTGGVLQPARGPDHCRQLLSFSSAVGDRNSAVFL
ncbi:proline-rich protein 2-like [Eriocheir sinensis]|uniref:proline-rich protein 2-like n=1 Tax=Eriocheir sinensis TaxID=95602 RepID=UPI0021CAA6D1|nr:proline-rich protein 2-like [Eriocheir sinensis]